MLWGLSLRVILSFHGMMLIHVIASYGPSRMAKHVATAAVLSLVGLGCGDDGSTATDAGTQRDSAVPADGSRPDDGTAGDARVDGGAGDGGPATDGGVFVDGGPGSDGGAPVPIPATSGTRLQMRVLTTSEGAEVFADWRDTELETDCAFGYAADGALRCLPTPAIPKRNEYFENDDCTGPVVIGNRINLCPLPDYVRREDRDACPRSARIYERGEELPSRSAIYRRDEDGMCESFTLLATARAFEVGAEVEPEAMVSGSVTTMATSTDLSRRVLEAEDGATMQWGLEDAREGVACALEYDEDERLRCMPEASARVGTYYTDDGCSDPLAHDLQPASCDPPSYARELLGNCPRTVAAYEIGEETDGTVYRATHSSCSSITSDSRLFTVSPLDSESFVEAEEVDGAVRGRLQEELAVVDDAIEQRRGWHDTELDVASSVRLADDGELRFLPDVPGVALSTRFYQDRDCRIPLIEHNAPCPASYAWDVDNSVCPRQYGIYELGPRHTGTVYLGSSICTAATMSIPVTLYRQGERIDVETLPRVTEELR